MGPYWFLHVLQVEVLTISVSDEFSRDIFCLCSRQPLEIEMVSPFTAKGNQPCYIL